jgi:hypothetical protein
LFVGAELVQGESAIKTTKENQIAKDVSMGRREGNKGMLSQLR